MISANDKIIVSVNFQQKESISLGGSEMLLAKQYSNNRRESMPVLCQVVDGNGKIENDTLLLVHHNRFSESSPHYLESNLYSLAFNNSIFAKIDDNGNAKGICGNIIVEHTFDKNDIIPDNLKKPNRFKYNVLQNGYGFKKGQSVYCYEFSDYCIIYVWKGVEHRVIKVKLEDIVGYLKK